MASNLEHNLHDAWLEGVKIGPRREVQLLLDLGSACLSDPDLPGRAALRLGGIADFERVRKFFARFERSPNARIDRITVRRVAGPSFAVTLEIEPLGKVSVVCSGIELKS